MKRVVGSGAVLLLAMMLLAGCGGSKKVAARVNKDLITEDDFNDRAQSVSVYGLMLSAQTRGPMKAGEYAMLHLIQDRLWEQLGAQKNIAPTDADINAYVAFAKEYLARQETANLTLMTPDPSRTESDWRRDAKITLIQRGIALAPLKVSQTDIQKKYDEVKAPLTPPDRYHLRVIQTFTAQDAQKALDSLKKGISFDTVALTQSQDPSSKARGGDIGIKRQTELPPDFVSAIKDLKPNEYAPRVIALKGGNPQQAPGTSYFLVQLVEKLPGRTPSLAEARFAVEGLLMAERERNWPQRVAGDYDAYRKSADIDIKLKPYEHLRDLFKATATPPAAAGPGAVSGAPGGAPGG